MRLQILSTGKKGGNAPAGRARREHRKAPDSWAQDPAGPRAAAQAEGGWPRLGPHRPRSSRPPRPPAAPAAWLQRTSPAPRDAHRGPTHPAVR